MKSFTSTDPQGHEGKTNTWLTPLHLIHPLGDFDLDPCGFPDHETAKNKILLPRDGLSEPWFGRVWLNPPYGKNILDWLLKLERHGNGIALVFARTDSKWFHIIKPTAIYFLKGRLRFLKPDLTEDSNAGTGSMLLAWGQTNVDQLYTAHRKGLIKGKLINE